MQRGPVGRQQNRQLRGLLLFSELTGLPSIGSRSVWSLTFLGNRSHHAPRDKSLKKRGAYRFHAGKRSAEKMEVMVSCTGSLHQHISSHFDLLFLFLFYMFKG
jgi:hypothetical protein